jgi:D-serine deaminase-like pyridoxal phosphate-dependent protein
MSTVALLDAPISTPALVVDCDVFDANVATAAALMQGTGKVLRPHVKTHRTPGLALRQLGSAAPGVTCAAVGEAEAMAESGIDDLLIANELVTDDKIERTAVLAKTARVSVAVDAPGPARSLYDAATKRGTTIDVLIDLDVGLGRCGVQSASAARELA